MTMASTTRRDSPPSVDDTAIHSLCVSIPEPRLVELRRRIQATSWPERETVADASRGARLAAIQELGRYWAAGYDWRRAEAKLNRYPQFLTRVDGLDLHFLHIRSEHPDALPLLLSHGWPGSVFEHLELIAPLTDPTAFGGRSEDAFDVVIPSLPGCGLSARTTEEVWEPERIGRAWDALMKRLGHTRYVVQGGDCCAGIVHALGRQAPPGLLGIHAGLPAAVLAVMSAALAPDGLTLSPSELPGFDALLPFLEGEELAHAALSSARPRAVERDPSDPLVGLAGWLLMHPGLEHWAQREDPGRPPTRDDVLDDFTLYWLTNSTASAAAIYSHLGGDLLRAAAQMTEPISIPVAVTAFADEVYRAAETWARRAFRNLVHFHEPDRGGRCAAWEHPELFAADLRTAFRSLR